MKHIEIKSVHTSVIFGARKSCKCSQGCYLLFFPQRGDFGELGRNTFCVCALLYEKERKKKKVTSQFSLKLVCKMLLTSSLFGDVYDFKRMGAEASFSVLLSFEQEAPVGY